MTDIMAKPAPRERSRTHVQCALLLNRNDDADLGDREDDQNSKNGEGTGDEQVEKGAAREEDSPPPKDGAEQDTGAGEDFASEITEILGGNQQQNEYINAPNPFKDPGLAEKFWHRKLNILKKKRKLTRKTRRKKHPSMARKKRLLHKFTNKNQDSTT